jgi:hypothetical protein
MLEAFSQVWRESLAAGGIRIPQCVGCGRWNWYPLPVCPRCNGVSFAWVTIAMEGVLHSWTRVHRSFSREHPTPVPYVVGIVTLTAAGGVRIPCRYGGRDHERPNFSIEEAVVLSVAGDGVGRHIVFTQ